MQQMHPMKFIRVAIFGMSLAEFADMSGSSTSRVSLWEKGTAEPRRPHMKAIREAAAARGLPFKDDWFYEQPELATAHGDSNGQAADP